MARVHAYHAVDDASLTAEVIAEFLMDADALPDLLLEFHPSVRLLRSQYAAVSLWAAHQGITELAAVDPRQPEHALVVRPEFDVEVIGLDAGASDFVAHLLQGESLGVPPNRQAATILISTSPAYWVCSSRSRPFPA